MSDCVGNMEVAPLTMEQFEILNKKNCMLEDENRKLKSDIRELQQVIVNMCHERYSHYRPDQDFGGLKEAEDEKLRQDQENDG